MENEVENRNKDMETVKSNKYFTIETIFDREEGISDQEYTGGLLSMVQQLLHAWTEEKAIDDAYDRDENLIERDYEEYGKWAIQPRVVKRKSHVKVDTIVHVKTTLKVYGLYMNQKEYCDQNDI